MHAGVGKLRGALPDSEFTCCHVDVEMACQDPKAPKGPTGAFMFIEREKRKEMFEAGNPTKIAPSDIQQEIGRMWRALSKTVKQVSHLEMLPAFKIFDQCFRFIAAACV